MNLQQVIGIQILISITSEAGGVAKVQSIQIIAGQLCQLCVSVSHLKGLLLPSARQDTSSLVRRALTP